MKDIIHYFADAVKASESTTVESPQNGKQETHSETSARKSDEHKEKLKRTKEKLIALADKKGYSKRKLAEIEEGERIEKAIKNRIKLFKGEEKKDNATMQTDTCQKPLSSSLLNYFSKAPLQLTQKDKTDMSTIIVKADVHVSEDLITRSSQKSSLNNKLLTNKKSKSTGMEFPQVDDISVISSQRINVLDNNLQEKPTLQRTKHRWSLRIKLRTNENDNSMTGNSSDEEIFSPRSKSKLSLEHTRKSDVLKQRTTNESEFPGKSSNKKNVKPLNAHSKLHVKRKGKSTQDEMYKTAVVDENSCEVIDVEDPEIIEPEKFKGSSSANVNTRQTNNDNSTDISKITASEEDCLIINENSTKRKSNKKLAPLFTKRRKPDPETVAARRLFLQPDITDNDSKNPDRKLNTCGVLPFPIISHITQLNSISRSIDEFNIPMKIENSYIPVINSHDYKSVTNLNTKKSPVRNISTSNVQSVQEILREIETQCSDARKMWDTISLLCKDRPPKKASPKAKGKRGRLFEKKEATSDRKNEENHTQAAVWTQKYKPTSTQEIVGNEEAAAKLRDWLDGWRSSLINEDVNSGDEFYTSDCSYSSSNENNQVAVLLGPHGSGKSASVYAVAEELGYTVLEVNASSKRTGKKLLKELEEATKSHRIKKENGNSVLFNAVSAESTAKKIPQNSLILLEDIDLIFDEDEGFVSATYQLASNTKRPIVMTCNDVCPHLSKMAPQQNRIYFQNPIGNRVSALLELISLAETGHRLPHSCIAELLRAGDLRKALLQLQYLLLSGSSPALEQSIHVQNSLWQNMRYCLYKPAIKENKKRKTKVKKAKRETPNVNATDMLDNIANKLDNAALISSLINVEDPVLNLSHVKTQPSLSLVEDTSSYCASKNISADIAEWIGKTILSTDHLAEHDGTRSQSNFILRKQLNKGVNMALSQVTSLILDRQALSMDYLPSIRLICRAEESRANMNSKRGNRFFHYLHGLKGPITTLKPNILAAACKAMQDKVEGNESSNNSNVV